MRPFPLTTIRPSENSTSSSYLTDNFKSCERYVTKVKFSMILISLISQLISSSISAMFVQVYPRHWLHLGVQCNPSFRHPHSTGSGTATFTTTRDKIEKAGKSQLLITFNGHHHLALHAPTPSCGVHLISFPLLHT